MPDLIFLHYYNFFFSICDKLKQKAIESSDSGSE